MMNKNGSVEWRIIWIIAILAAVIILIALFLLLYFAEVNGTSPFVLFGNMFGGK